MIFGAQFSGVKAGNSFSDIEYLNACGISICLLRISNTSTYP